MGKTVRFKSTTVINMTGAVELFGGAVGNLVDAGGPYSGFEKAAIQLYGRVRFEDDPSPAILWTIESGGTGTFSDATIEKPTFTPDTPGPYVLRLTGTGTPGGALFDLANLESVERQDVSFIGSFDPFNLVVDEPISPRDVSPAYTGDWTPLVYSLTGAAWPAWVNLDVNTGIITGTPDTVELTTGHTVTATDADSNTAVSNIFDINVVAGAEPISFDGNIGDINATKDEAITPVQAWQEFSGTQTPITFTPAGTPLPAGIVLSTDGVISGTPTNAANTTGHIIRGTDANAATADSNTYSINVSEAWTPAQLFQSGELGGYYDPSDISTLWQDTAGTIPVTANGQNVLRMDDLSGNGAHIVATVPSPTYQDGKLEFAASEPLAEPVGRSTYPVDMTVAAAYSPHADQGSYLSVSGAVSSVASRRFVIATRNNATGYVEARNDAEGTFRHAIGSVPDDSINNAIAWQDSGTLYSMLNGVETSVASGATHLDNPMRVICGNVGNITIYASVVISRVLTAQERTDLAAWLQARLP